MNARHVSGRFDLVGTDAKTNIRYIYWICGLRLGRCSFFSQKPQTNCNYNTSPASCLYNGPGKVIIFVAAALLCRIKNEAGRRAGLPSDAHHWERRPGVRRVFRQKWKTAHPFLWLKLMFFPRRSLIRGRLCARRQAGRSAGSRENAGTLLLLQLSLPGRAAGRI